MGSTQVFKVHPPLDPGIDLSARGENEGRTRRFAVSLLVFTLGNDETEYLLRRLGTPPTARISMHTKLAENTTPASLPRE